VYAPVRASLPLSMTSAASSSLLIPVPDYPVVVEITP
jgi:hypothetical protein